jgi:hypothetical protein
MSNLIFCNVDDLLVKKIKEIAKDRIVVDCGAGRGLFGSMYDGDVLSLDLELPDEPLSHVLERNTEHYCYPINSIPIFIRPCHSYFVHRTILANIYKFDDVLYVSRPENLARDLYLDSGLYEVEQIPGWEGEEGERLHLIKVNNKRKKDKLVLAGTLFYYADPMLSNQIESVQHEFKYIEGALDENGILLDGLRVRMSDSSYPMHEKYDHLIFDWGGMSLGNSMLEHVCRYVLDDALEHENRNYIVSTSNITLAAMVDAMRDRNLTSLPNVFLSIDMFADFIKNTQKK